MSTHFKYSYRWARDIVWAFTEKHTRGHTLLSKMLTITPGECSHYLTVVLARGNSLLWEILKRVIKILDGEDREYILRFSPSERKELYKCLRNLATDDQLNVKPARDLLDNIQNRRLF